MMTLHRVARAREEILRLNVEIRRLHTRIVDEGKHFEAVIGNLEGNFMYKPVLDYVSRRRAVNTMLLLRIQETYALPGFSGIPTPGTTKHPFPVIPQRHPHPDEMDTSAIGPESGAQLNGEGPREGEGDSSEDEGPLDDEDEYTDNVKAVVDFISNLTV